MNKGEKSYVENTGQSCTQPSAGSGLNAAGA
jgi:hypothetical protein